MKKIAVLIIIFSFFSASFAQSRKEIRAERKAKLEADFSKTKDLITSNNFMFEANWATPLGNDVANISRNFIGGNAVFQGNRVNLSSNTNFIKITDTTADVFLPYFGRVFFPTRNPNDTGIAYKGDIENYSVDINEKKKHILIKWEANPDGDNIQFIMKINASGYATVGVNSMRRQNITYNGNIKSIAKVNAN